MIEGVDEIRREVEALARREGEWVGGELTDDLRLIEDLRLDSIRLLSLAVAVEDRFRIRLDETDEARIRTVGDLVEIVRREVERRPPSDLPAGTG